MFDVYNTTKNEERGKKTVYVPCDYNYKIHDVPYVSQVRSFVQSEAQRYYLQKGLHAKNAQEVHFGVVLLHNRQESIHLTHDEQESTQLKAKKTY